jgi:hypothetical protein
MKKRSENQVLIFGKSHSMNNVNSRFLALEQLKSQAKSHKQCNHRKDLMGKDSIAMS